MFIINGFLFFLVALLHLYWFINLREEGLKVELINELHQKHVVAQNMVHQNLFSKCNILLDKNEQQKISNYLKQFKVNFYLTKKDLLSIGDLTYKQIIFKTYLEADSEIFYMTKGYLVQNENSQKCFGIL